MLPEAPAEPDELVLPTVQLCHIMVHLEQTGKEQAPSQTRSLPEVVSFAILVRTCDRRVRARMDQLSNAILDSFNKQGDVLLTEMTRVKDGISDVIWFGLIN